MKVKYSFLFLLGMLFEHGFAGVQMPLTTVLADSVLCRQHDGLFYSLLSGSLQEQQDIIDKITEDPDCLEPPVLFAMANALFRLGQKDKAVFWYQVAQIRGLYAVNLMMERLQTYGRKELSLYVQYLGESIVKYAASDIRYQNEKMEEALHYVAGHTEKYYPLWLYSIHSLPLYKNRADTDLIKPEREWPAIKNETIQYYTKRLKNTESP